VAAVAVRISDEPERTRFVADLTRAVGFKVYVLPDPYRVIVDLPEVDFRLPDDSATGRAGSWRATASAAWNWAGRASSWMPCSRC
jgi:hypothetical protein